MSPLTDSDDERDHRISVRRRVSYAPVNCEIVARPTVVSPTRWVGSMLLNEAPFANGLLPSQDVAHWLL
jgi:hypothetical protein